jgi:uroporphyrinogen-III synthase
VSRPLAVLRPEPGNAATAARIEALGLRAIRLPLFAVRPLDWMPPDTAAIDALLITSANAVRHGGPGLASLRHLPVIAVGQATARAAAAAGFTVEATGEGGVHDVLWRTVGRRLLHLSGRDVAGESGLPGIAVYASEPVRADASPLNDSVALIHSPRAAARLAELVEDRARVRIAAISAAAAAAAGDGWAASAVAAQPSDAAVIAAARTLAD